MTRHSPQSLAVPSRIRVFRVTFAHVDAQDQASAALTEGRGHRVGEPVPAYTSESDETAEREFRTHLPPDPTGTLIRITPLSFEGLLLDGTDRAVRRAAGVTLAGLLDENDRSATQTLCDYARAIGADGVRVPSVRHKGHHNVIVLYERRGDALTDEDPEFKTL